MADLVKSKAKVLGISAPQATVNAIASIGVVIVLVAVIAALCGKNIFGFIPQVFNKNSADASKSGTQSTN